MVFGPPFLWKPEREWPEQPEGISILDDDAEVL